MSKIVRSQQDAFATSGEREHIDVLNDGTRQRVKVCNILTASNFLSAII